MIFEIPNPFSVAGFLKLDISDLPVILVTWCFGPWSGLATAAIKVVLHLMVGGDWLGSLSNLISAACLIFPFNWAFQHPKWKLYKRLYIGGAVATITLTLVMSLLNLWVLVPLYSVVWGWHKCADGTINCARGGAVQCLERVDISRVVCAIS
ncbi:ECF transporter S component [Limosilactobacillus equigenerosi]|uniref:ECF transporter S component n=1 Tax=Limosilactobacillus equigenerosi TaxID=417373 RepID=UPI000A74DECD|nr:ECF transporter S component [Limosilactobacillus equigenerosi]